MQSTFKHLSLARDKSASLISIANEWYKFAATLAAAQTFTYFISLLSTFILFSASHPSYHLLIEPLLCHRELTSPLTVGRDAC